MRVWVTVEVDWPVEAGPDELDEELLIREVRRANVERIVGWELPDFSPPKPAHAGPTAGS